MTELAAHIRPLDTAPRDGTRVLLWIDRAYSWQIGQWRDDAMPPRWRWSEWPNLDRARPPQGWAPLPPQPVLPPPAIPGAI